MERIDEDHKKHELSKAERQTRTRQEIDAWLERMKGKGRRDA